MITIQDMTPHHPATCIFCRNDALPEPHPDHIHTYDSDLGVTCKWDSVLEASVLVIQCDCGHEREIEGIMHPEPAPATIRPTAYLTEFHRGHRVRGCYSPDRSIACVYVEGSEGIVFSFEVEAHKIWNSEAHFRELIDSILDHPAIEYFCVCDSRGSNPYCPACYPKERQYAPIQDPA